MFEKVGFMPDAIKELKDLEKLPITKKADLVNAQKENPPFGGFEIVSEAGVRRIYVSPGPVFEPGEWDYDDIRWAQALFACGIRKGDVVLNTFNYHLTPLAIMLDESLQMLGGNGHPCGSRKYFHADQSDAPASGDRILGNAQLPHVDRRCCRGYAA